MVNITEEFKKLFNAEDIKRKNDSIGRVLYEDEFYFLAQEEFKHNCRKIESNNYEMFKNRDYDYHHDENGKCVENWYDEYEDNIIQYYMKELHRVYDYKWD